MPPETPTVAFSGVVNRLGPHYARKLRLGRLESPEGIRMELERLLPGLRRGALSLRTGMPWRPPDR